MTSLPSETDVLVVGAGPTGLALTARLVAAGVETVVVDKSPRRSKKSRASVVHSRALEVLEAIGSTDSLIENGAEIRSVAYYDMGLQLGEVRFDTLHGSFPFALGIGQNEVEKALIDRLRELKVKVRRSTSIAAAEDKGDHVLASLIDADGETHTLCARYLVGCDGATSTVRDLMDLSTPESGRVDHYVLADVEVGGKLDPAAMHMFSAPEGFLVLSPLPGGKMRLALTVGDDDGIPTREQLQALVNARGPRSDKLTISQPQKVSHHAVRRDRSRQMRSGRVFLAGDAAHVLAPVGGQGMNTGLHDGDNLAWKLAAVCQGRSPVSLLETYDTERRRAAVDALDRTERLSDALTMHNPIARAARDTFAVIASRVEVLQRPLQRGLAGFDAVYSAGDYTAGAVTAGPLIAGWGRPGHRMRAIPPGLLHDGLHHLFLIDDINGTGVDSLQTVAELADRYAEPIAIHLSTDQPGEVTAATAWTDARPDLRRTPKHLALMLVRPDGHVGWTGSLRELDELTAHLDRWFAPALSLTSRP